MNKFIWINGKIFLSTDATINVTDRGFLLGDGIFETMRVVNKKIPHLRLHFSRMEKGCDILFFPSLQKELLIKGIEEILKINEINNGSLRLTITRGDGPRGIIPSGDTNLTILLQVFDPSKTILPPVKLVISRYFRDGRSPLSVVKSTNFLPSILSRIEAKNKNYDDALLLGQTGSIAEATAANIVFLKNNILVTPPLLDGALPGTSRERLLKAGLCEEVSVKPEELSSMQGAWLINALSIAPVTTINHFSMKKSFHKGEVIKNYLFPDIK